MLASQHRAASARDLGSQRGSVAALYGKSSGRPTSLLFRKGGFGTEVLRRPRGARATSMEAGAGECSGPGGEQCQPSMRWVLQKEVRSVDVAAWAAALNSATVEMPNQWPAAYERSRFVMAVSPMSRRRSCRAHLPYV